MKEIITVVTIAAMVYVQQSLQLQHGRLRTYSDSRDGTQIVQTNSTYPNGSKQRDFITTSDHLTCTSCDPIGRQEVCVSNYCVHLGDTAVFVFLNNATLKETLRLNGCIPRYLEQSTVTESVIFVLCRPTDTGQPQYRDLYINGQQFELTSKIVPNGNSFPLTPHNGVFSGGQNENYLQQDFFIYIEDNEVYLEVVGGYESPRQLNFQSQADVCDTKDSLHAMPPRDNKPRFLLNCTKSNVTKWFIVTVDTPEDLSLEVTEINDSNGTPFASTTAIAFLSNNNLTIYEMANLRRYPGIKTFSRPIKQIDFLSSNQLLVVVSGQNHSLIDVPKFVRSVGERGVSELPSSVAYCPIGGTCLPHKLVTEDVLVLFIRNQSFYDAIFYNLTDPAQRLGTLPRFINRPQVVFYDHLPSPDPPPTTLPTSSPPTSLLSPSPPPMPPIVSTTTSNPVSSLAIPGPSSTVLDPSSVLPGVPPSSPPLESTPTYKPQQIPNTGLTERGAIAIAVTIAVVAVLFIAVVGYFVCRRSHFPKHPSEHFPCLHCQSYTTSPEQEAPKSHHREAPLGKEDPSRSTATPVPSSDEELSSGYTSQVSSRHPTPPPPRDQVTPPRDQAAPPDGTSQDGDTTLAFANTPPLTQIVNSSELVIGTSTQHKQVK